MGYNVLQQRLFKEFQLLSKDFMIEFDDDNYFYVKINRVPLVSGYSQRFTSVLIKIPKGYPTVAPEHFFLKKSLTYKGRTPAHMFKDNSFNELSKIGWAKFCVHPKKRAWRPSQNISKGDSLVSFLDLVRSVLDNRR